MQPEPYLRGRAGEGKGGGGLMGNILIFGTGRLLSYEPHCAHGHKSKKLLEIAMNVNEQENGINNKIHVDCNYLYICKLLAAI